VRSTNYEAPHYEVFYSPVTYLGSNILLKPCSHIRQKFYKRLRYFNVSLTAWQIVTWFLHLWKQAVTMNEADERPTKNIQPPVSVLYQQSLRKKEAVFCV
jgi:hypothetical protein